MDETQRWTVSCPELHWRSWDDDVVVFNECSGDTHLLNRAGAEILRFLIERPANLGDLIDLLVRRLDVEADDHLSAFIKSALADFAKLGLIKSLNQ